MMCAFVVHVDVMVVVAVDVCCDWSFLRVGDHE